MPYEVVTRFERALCKYTGARFACAVNSCTAALLLAVQWNVEALSVSWRPFIKIPSRTYPSVPMSIWRAGGKAAFRDVRWRGAYELETLPRSVWDCARRFTGNMYVPGQFQCVSFSTTKILGLEQGGAILHDDPEADLWFRRMRFDGRTPGVNQLDDTYDLVGHHCIMLPSTAAALTLKLYHLPRYNEDLPEIEYPNLSLAPPLL